MCLTPVHQIHEGDDATSAAAGPNVWPKQKVDEKQNVNISFFPFTWTAIKKL